MLDPELLERITARRAELDELEEQLDKQLAEVRAERDELAVAERVLERMTGDHAIQLPDLHKRERGLIRILPRPYPRRSRRVRRATEPSCGQNRGIGRHRDGGGAVPGRGHIVASVVAEQMGGA
ncbi:hypothetical protein [Streptomyces sp. NBC_00063]|uniref:hypothetical protein n=1 Tax=Streptomyces sp. NBC_00063 TaxID=2975638 RepID=UPI003D705712